AVLGANRLARNQVLARNEALGVLAEIDVDAVAVDTLDDAAHQRAEAALVGLDHLRALRLAHLLHDHLPRSLRVAAAEVLARQRHLDETADFGIGVDVARILEPQLALRELELSRVVGEHFPAPERIVVAALAVDRDTGVNVVAVPLAGRRRE